MPNDYEADAAERDFELKMQEIEDNEEEIKKYVKRLIEINREGYQITEELTRLGVDKDGDPLY